MILHCSFEELSAMNTGAARVLSRVETGAHVAAPPEGVADLEALVPRLSGDLSIVTLADQRRVARALDYLYEELRDRMEATILREYVGSEDSVIAFFDYAHVATVRERVRSLGREMIALIELMTGETPSDATASSITFPDD